MNPLFAHHQIPLLPRPGAARAWGSKAHLSAVKAACKSAERVNGALSLAGRFETALVPAEPDFFDTAPGMVKARTMAWNVIRQSGNIIWIIVTRMPENISKSLPGDWLGKGYSNVVFGIAVDDGPNLSEKLSALQSTPARHRMLLVTPSSPCLCLDWVPFQIHRSTPNRIYESPLHRLNSPLTVTETVLRSQ